MPARQRVIVEADDISCPAWWPRDAAPVRLAYTINGGSMLRMSQIDGSGRRLLAGLQVEIVDMAWSVDGERLAVVDAAGQRFGLVPIDGSSPTWVALADARDVAWSSDGKLVAAATPDSVIVFDANGGEVVSIGRTLADGQVPAVAWAPDGHSLAWVDDSGTLVRHAVDDGTRLERSVGELSSQGSLVVRGWSPDGAWVLISANSPLTRGSSGALTAVPWDPSLDPVVLVSPDAGAGAAQADWQPIYP